MIDVLDRTPTPTLSELKSLGATNRIFRFIFGYALCRRMNCSYLQKKEITDDDDRLLEHSVFAFCLPTAVAGRRAQGTRRQGRFWQTEPASC